MLYCMKAFIFLLLFLNSNLSADGTFPIYYLSDDAFSIKGYDLEYQGTLPYKLHQDLKAEWVAKIDLPEGSYRDLIVITDPETGKTCQFHSRIIQNGEFFTVEKVKEIFRISQREDEDFSSGFSSKVRYEITFANGLTFQVGRESLGLDGTKPAYINDTIVAGDQIRFLSENQATLNFKKAGFTVLLYRNGKRVELYWASGPSRKSKPIHINDPLAHVILETGGLFSYRHEYAYGSSFTNKEMNPPFGRNEFILEPGLVLSNSTVIYTFMPTKLGNSFTVHLPNEIRAGTQILRKAADSHIFINLANGEEWPLNEWLDSKDGWRR